MISAQEKQRRRVESRGGRCSFYRDGQGHLTERVTFDLKESEGVAM